MALPKPQTTDELIPPFAVVGEEGWDTRLRAWLTNFEFPFGRPSTLTEITRAESRLEQILPADWRAFLLTFGPLDLDGVRLTAPARIARMDGVWFRSHLDDQEQALLPNLLQIGECGSDNYIAYNIADGWVCECCHDPGGLFDWCPSFSDFLRVKLVRLWSGYYGWPDPEVWQLTDTLTQQWLTSWDQRRHNESR